MRPARRQPGPADASDPLRKLAERIEGVAEGARVSGVRTTKRDPSRASIYVSGAFVCALDKAAVQRLGLAEGDVWTRETGEALLAAADADKAKRFAMRSIARRAVSRAEMARKLTRRGHGRRAVEMALDDLARLGLLDDEALAQAAARSIASRKPAGKRLIEAKLRQRGLDADLAAAAADAALESRDALEDAVTLASSRSRSMSRLEPEVARRRLLGLLARRGFEPEVCWEAVRRVMAAMRGDGGGGGDDG